MDKWRESVAAQNFERDKILCWIMTSPKNLDTKGRAVRDTWLKRCDISLFMSSEANDTFPTVKLNVSEGRHHLTAKTMQAFRYVYNNYFHNATWFLKADDDTYVMVENLRYFLSSENTSDPVYFGHHFQIYVKQGYHSGGAGYVLSKEALRRFGENQDVRLCKPDGANEDLEFGHCMENLGVRAGNSTDSHGNTRFHCLNLESHVFGNYPDWYWDRDSYAAKKKAENISEYAISFHYVQPNRMYLLDFYIYHLKVYQQ